MDLCDGGDLHSRKLNEQQVTIVAEQILMGVAYLHRRGICHRDLKMENILYENGKKSSPIRLIDFGLSLTYDQNQNSVKQKFVGAAYTLSPEVLAKKPYTEKSDMWSIGIIIWILLAGDFPFIRDYEDLKKEGMRKKLEKGDYNFGITWRGRGITENAKEFVRGCLTCDPTDRWSALQALEFLQDKWIPHLEAKAKQDEEANARIFPEKSHKKDEKMKKYTKVIIPTPMTISQKRTQRGVNLFDKEILDGIKRFAQYSLFKKTILVTLANTMDSKDVGEVRELFLLIDTNQSGTITLPELKKVLHKADREDMNDDENIEMIFSAIDYDGSGDIHYAEFLAALSETHGLITHDRLADSFDRIDSTGKGFIIHDDLKNILGENYTKETADKMIEEGDFKKNGQIDFDEFCQLLEGNADENNGSAEVDS
jgi:calcium-dependent protein kinase